MDDNVELPDVPNRLSHSNNNAEVRCGIGGHKCALYFNDPSSNHVDFKTNFWFIPRKDENKWKRGRGKK